ncbi:MAG: nitrous oxide reductase accessory protein NosL [Chromatiaceae bacterium]
MCDHHHNQGRREALKVLGALGLAGLGTPVLAANAATIGAFMPGKGWMPAGASCEGDGTPLQFIPRTAPDANPLVDELKKYPKCPYCGMDRTEFHFSRHLVQYDDDLVDGTCSIHCLAISLMLNMDRGPKALYAADFGSPAEIKPLVLVDKATYLIGSKLKGTMTANSKVAFADKAQAEAAMAKEGGALGTFDQTLNQTMVDMAADTARIRKNRAEKRQKMMPKA